MNVKQIVLLTFIFVACVATSFLCGYTVRDIGIDQRYEERITELTRLNTDLQNENLRAGELVKKLTRDLEVTRGQLDEVTGRLGRAAEIVGSIKEQVEGDVGKIQRALYNVSRLEEAIRIIFEGK